MNAPIDLDRLEQLAADATPGPWFSENHGDITEIRNVGMRVAWSSSKQEGDLAFIAACDPAIVAALVRAVKAAERHAQICDDESPGAWDTLLSLREALAPFREQTG
jgi:hypothetical protein